MRAFKMGIDGAVPFRCYEAPEEHEVEVPFENRATRRHGVRVYRVVGNVRTLLSEQIDWTPLPLDWVDEIYAKMAEMGIDVRAELRKDIEEWPKQFWRTGNEANS